MPTMVRVAHTSSGIEISRDGVTGGTDDARIAFDGVQYPHQSRPHSRLPGADEPPQLEGGATAATGDDAGVISLGQKKGCSVHVSVNDLGHTWAARYYSNAAVRAAPIRNAATSGAKANARSLPVHWICNSQFYGCEHQANKSGGSVFGTRPCMGFWRRSNKAGVFYSPPARSRT
jgi:hypothetical protein